MVRMVRSRHSVEASIIPEVAKMLSIREDLIENVKVEFENGILLLGEVDPEKIKVKGVKVRYVTTEVPFVEYFGEINKDNFSVLEYYKGEIVKVDSKFYRVSEEAFERIKEDVKNALIKNWDSIKMAYAKTYADYPIDIKPVDSTFEKFTLKYRPVFEWVGDEFRGDDVYRSSVEDRVVESTEDLKIFTSALNEFIKNAFFKNAECIGEVKEIELKLSDEDKDRLTKIIRKAQAEENRKRAIDTARLLIKSVKESTANVSNAYELKKIIEKYGVEVDQDVLNWINKVTGAKTILIKYGDRFAVDTPENLKWDSSELLDVFNEEYKTVAELPINVLEKHKIIDKTLESLEIKDTNINYIVDDYKINREIKVILEKVGAEVIYHEVSGRRKNIEFWFVKFNNKPETRNISIVSPGVIIGKGGENIKNLAKKVELRFIKLV